MTDLTSFLMSTNYDNFNKVKFGKFRKLIGSVFVTKSSSVLRSGTCTSGWLVQLTVILCIALPYYCLLHS